MASSERMATEKLAGLLLMASAAAALLLAHSPLAEAYSHVLHLEVGPRLPGLGVPTVHEWIADGLMAIFFLLVGLEVKREWFEGRLSTAAERKLPIVAAVAGMIEEGRELPQDCGGARRRCKHGCRRSTERRIWTDEDWLRHDAALAREVRGKK